MKYFVSTSSDLDALGAAPDIGVMTGPRVGGLGSILSGRPWASDCDALSKDGFCEDRFLQHLERLSAAAATCAFVVVPDVPGCGESTLATFEHACRVYGELEFPLAYCLQDGAEHLELPPCDVAFLGGTDLWREAVGAALLERARAEGLRTHVGRVNSERRLRHLSFCHCDSADGTYIGFRGVERGVREVGAWLRAAHDERLFTPGDLRAVTLTEERVQTLRALSRRRRSPRLGEMQAGTPDLFGAT